jgi:Protein of unknown function (DUF1236)
MRRTFMIGVAAGALLAGVNIAASQSTMGQQPGASGSSGGAGMEQKSGGGAEQRQRAQDTQKQGDQQKSQGAQKQDTKQDAQKQDTKQDAQKQDTKQDAQKKDAQSKDAQKSGSGQSAGSDKAGGGGKTLSAEQKTKIRQTVISSGPRVNNVNFSVSVGTVIPRTVTLAALPPILVEIYPEWRSYRYVIVEERVVIVEPDTFKIVAVLVV